MGCLDGGSNLAWLVYQDEIIGVVQHVQKEWPKVTTLTVNMVKKHGTFGNMGGGDQNRPPVAN